MLFKATVFFVLLASLLVLKPQSSALAFNVFGQSCTGAAANSPVCKDAASKGGDNPVAGKNGILQTAANIVAVLTGIAAVIMIIAGGFSYATSGGSTEKVATARRRILSALIGLVVVAMAWAITTFVISHFIN